MADSESTQDKPKRTSAAKAEPDASPKQQSAGNGNGETAPPIPVAQLIADGSALLGHPSHAVAGALYGHPADEELDIDAAKEMVEAWLGQEVQVDPATQPEEEE